MFDRNHQIFLTTILAGVALSMIATCATESSDDDNDSANSDQKIADDDTDAVDDAQGGDDSEPADDTDESTEPPLPPCDIRGAWRASIADLLGEEAVILVVETREYSDIYGAWLYEGCSQTVDEYSGEACDERDYAGESDGLQFRFTAIGGAVALWYEGDITTDCAQWIGRQVETWPCCSSIYSSMTAYKM